MFDYTLKYRTLVAYIGGDIDHENAPQIKLSMDNVIKSESFDNFVIDLSAVTFMDSSAVGLIMGRYKLLKSMGKSVSFSKPSSVADKVLKVSGLYTSINKI